QHSIPYTRSRTERLMRFMLRRKPCVVVMVAEFVTILSFTVMVLALLYMMRLTKDHERHIQAGIRLMEILSDKITLWHCQYELPPYNLTSFHKATCHIAIGSDAVSVALQHTITPENCADIIYEVQCHSAVEGMRAKRRVPHIEPQSCAGLFGAPMPYELVSSEHVVYAPRIRNEDLKKFKGQLMFSLELIIQCPRCRVVTGYYSDDNDNNNTDQICRRQLETIRVGWPNNAEFCDEEERLVVDLEKQIYC
ncbi:hypothetical protein Tcan_14258, partial [Toxocara canis]